MQLSQAKPQINSIYEQKKFLRAHYTQKRKELGQDERMRQSDALVLSVSSHSCFIRSNTILCYYPIEEEPSILPLANIALSLGKTVAFPISNTKDHTLSFRSVKDLSQLKSGAYRIPEPTANMPEISDFSESLCIVPALAFDLRGYRIGYGKGFYDRFLSTFNGVSLGLAYDKFVTDVLPHDATDQNVDIIITEGRVYNVKKLLQQETKN